MNRVLQSFSRAVLKKGLSECSPEQQMIFKRMYVTRDFSGEKLDWAMRQVISTILKNQKKDQETWENAS